MNTPKSRATVPEAALPMVISASRRTDIPAFYMGWFMRRIEKGGFDIVNPYNRRTRFVAAGPQQVHSIVFWSKNFGPFIAGDFGPRLSEMGYHLFYNFTINSAAPLLEPHVPPLTERLAQLQRLAADTDSRAITWRFDPICFYQTGGGRLRDNLHDFEQIAETAARLAIRRCITSFVDLYPKIEKRVAQIPEMAFVDPPLSDKVNIIRSMHAFLSARGIDLQVCCEKPLLEMLPTDLGVKPAACISHDLLTDIHGGRLSGKTDKGQRVGQGCGCQISIDVGSYALHPCYHRCLFCYANPATGPERSGPDVSRSKDRSWRN